MDWYHLASTLINVPAAFILLLLLGLVVHIKSNWLGVSIIGVATALLLIFSLPLTAHQLSSGLETVAPLPFPPAEQTYRAVPSAIVILGGGRYREAPEYGADTVSRVTLERLRYGAVLQRATKLPVLLSAGAVFQERQAESALMLPVMTQEFNVPVRWTEENSRTTFENAQYSYEILRAAGIKHIFLVTHALHMRRASLVFRQTGIKVTEAPLGFVTLEKRDFDLSGYLPSAFALHRSSQALHEYIGLQYYKYRLRSLSPPPATAEKEEL